MLKLVRGCRNLGIRLLFPAVPAHVPASVPYARSVGSPWDAGRKLTPEFEKMAVATARAKKSNTKPAKTSKPAAAPKPAKAKGPDYKVKDMSLAAWGRKEIELAENEMPGLM